MQRSGRYHTWTCCAAGFQTGRCRLGVKMRSPLSKPHVRFCRLRKIRSHGTMCELAGDLPVVAPLGRPSKELPPALDRLDVMHPTPIPIRAEPAATRCGEMVE